MDIKPDTLCITFLDCIELVPSSNDAKVGTELKEELDIEEYFEERDGHASIQSEVEQVTTTDGTLRHYINTEKKPFQCELCNLKCDREILLQEHMSKHSDEILFECATCGYKALKRCSLSRHMRVHYTVNKPYQCQLCAYKCTKNYQLVRHMTVHAKEKSLYCNFCDYKGAGKRNLRWHLATHSQRPTFNCELCDFKGPKRICLLNHMTSCHTVEEW